MKITKNDLKLTKSEYLQVIELMNTKTVLTYDADHYQCADCHNIYERVLNVCPNCGGHSDHSVTKGKTRYDLRTIVQTFRKVGNHVVELVFMISDTQNKGFHRRVNLIRKSEYKDDINIMVSQKLSYEPMNQQFRLWDYYGYWVSGYTKREGWASEKPSNIKGYSLGIDGISINKHILLEHPILNRIYFGSNIQDITNKHIEQAFKFPYLLEMLYKRSNREDLYYALATIKRYKDAYLKYHNYFERYGSFNPHLLQKLNRVEGMLKYNTFEKLMAFHKIPKEYRTKEELELLSNIVVKRYGSYRYDERTHDDYLRMAEERGLNTSRNEVRFDSKWNELHDQWTKEIELEKELKKEKKFLSIYKKFKDEYIDGILIQPPHSIKDLFHESEKLHHCVKSYSDKIISKKSLVFFIRLVPGEPFITAEVEEGKIVQTRGLNNNMDMIKDEHKKALNKYIKKYLGRGLGEPRTNQASY